MPGNSIIIDPSQEKRAESIDAAAAVQKNPPASGQEVDVLILAFFYLMEASNTTAQSAIVHSKQLNQNAAAQQQLNNQGAQLQWNYVPSLQVDHHASVRETDAHWTWTFWNHNGFEYFTYKTIPGFDTNPNQGAVNNAMAQNQEVVNERQIISERLNVLQQNAQIGESTVNTCTDESMQAMQASQYIMQILQSLTYKALMRQPAA